MRGFLVEVVAALVAGIIIEIVRIALRPTEWSSLVKTLLESWKRVLLYAAIIFVLCFLSDLTPIRLCETVRVWVLGLPKQEQMVSEALESYDRGDFQSAIDRSRAVISEYEPAAKEAQNALAENPNAEKWPTGKVPFAKSWKTMEIFDRGSLNSVSLAWWIAGRSEEKLGRGCEAKDDFEAAAAYSYARSWDPQSWPIRGWSPFGWFWSPPDDARYRAKSVACQKAQN